MPVSPKLSPKYFLVLAPLTALGLAAAPAHAAGATTLDFDNFSASSAGGFVQVGPTYSAQGFTLTSPTNFFALNGGGRYGDGETSLNTAASATLTQDSGAAFSFNAIDLGPFEGNFSGTQFDGPVLFTGARADGTTVTATETTTGSRYRTFTFTGFTDLTSLTFTGNDNSGGASAFQFDNIKLNQAAPVPEASTRASLGLMLALGLGAVLVSRRKKAAAGL